MDDLSSYLPRDRFLALAMGTGELPNRTCGTALFADISGFTPLAEALATSLGPLRGPEELTRQINAIFDAVIAAVDRFGGSVVSFAGDAITCWFEGDTGHLGTAAALAMQEAMGQFAAVSMPGGRTVGLSMKVGLAQGPARRFVVGDPSLQRMDVLAGATLSRMAAAQGLGRPGEVVADLDVTQALGATEAVAQWRTDTESGMRFAVVRRTASPLPSGTSSAAAPLHLAPDRLREWLPGPVFTRLAAGQSAFLTELRPVVVLFLKFGGIDYDGDDQAGEQLDAYVRWVQRVLADYEGFLLGVLVGDKGSYLYGAFGAPVVHENDPWRALTVALALRDPPEDLARVGPIQIGLNRGTICAGAYGGRSRRTYGILGDEVNLAARLMQSAAPGQILVSARVRRNAEESFVWRGLPPMPVKGKAQPVQVSELVEPARSPRGLLQASAYALPMVGRQAELASLREGLGLVLKGRGQVTTVVAEAGMGKSRLLAESIRLAGSRGVVAYTGECQSYGTHTSYLAWVGVWQDLFELDPAQTPAQQVLALEKHLSRIDPALTMRLPLLGAVTRLSIPDNFVTRSFDAKLRKASLEALLVDCLRARARRGPLLVILEDAHWIDPLSRDLLRTLAQAIADVPVLLVVAYRPEDPRLRAQPLLDALPHTTEIRLTHLGPEEVGELVRLKLAQFGGIASPPSTQLIERLVARVEGNPFYAEELLNYLHDRGIPLDDPERVARVELPNNLQALILSRIDQLTESQQITLKVASVIGRLFRAAMLAGAYPQLNEPHRLAADLDQLQHLDLTRLDVPEPERVYIFKHAVTQEVAYESLPFSTRAMLHGQLGRFIEQTYRHQLAQHYDLLAYHFDRSGNEPKRREYLRKAGEAAQAQYANAAALDYYQRLVPLLDEPERVPVMLRLGQVLELVGRWQEARARYAETLSLAERLADRSGIAQAQAATADLLRKQGQYADAAHWFDLARVSFEALADEAGVGQVLHGAGTLAAQQGDHVAACALYEQSLAIRRRQQDRAREASLLSNLAILAHQFAGDFARSRHLHEQALGLRRELGDRWAIANSLNNLALVCRDQGDLVTARALLEESVTLNRQVGDRWAIANSLSSLGDVALDQRDFARGRACLTESLAINRELDDRRAIAFLFEYFGKLAALEGHAGRALRLVGAAAALREVIGTPLSPAETAQQERLLDVACAALSPADRQRELETGRSLGFAQALTYATIG